MSGNIVQISGQIVNTSGQVANISGQTVIISGQAVSVSGNIVQISGQDIFLNSGSVTSVINASGQGSLIVSISGNVIGISGQVAQISGQSVVISGQSVSVSGNIVQISGQDVFLNSGSVTSVINASGQGSLVVTNSGDIAEISGQVVNISGQSVTISGNVVQISGQVAQTSGQVANISGQSVTVSGSVVQISGQSVTITSGSMVAIASGQAIGAFTANNPNWAGIYSFATVDTSGVAAANFNYVTLFNPTGNSRNLILVESTVIRYSIAASTIPSNLRMERITAVSGGIVISSSTINKYDTTSPVESADVRTSNPSIIEGARVATFGNNQITGGGNTTNGFRQTFTPKAIFILRPGEGVAIGQDRSGDTVVQNNFEIIWAEQ